MEKPTFPKPRIIREDFLPGPMKNYRIKKVTENGETVYYPQKRILWQWVYMQYGYSTLKKAQEEIFSDIKKPEPVVVEYIYDLE